MSTAPTTAALQTPDGKYNIALSITPVPPPVVTPPPASAEPVIPANAVVIDLLPTSIPWQMNFDAGTQNSAKTANSSGTTTYPFKAPDGTLVRLFDFTDVNKGGEIYHVNVLKDSSAYNCFCLEAVEMSADWSNVACAEKDLEHANAKGVYVDLATQLSTYSGKVEVTGGHKWQATAVAADPSKRAPNVLHTTRMFTKDNGDGTGTYRGITLDGTYSPINVTLNDQGATAWGANVLNIQIQYDSKVAGSVEAKVLMYILRVHAWKE
jgi:hypothetical protein